VRASITLPARRRTLRFAADMRLANASMYL
jgi:hypothetical protein